MELWARNRIYGWQGFGWELGWHIDEHGVRQLTEEEKEVLG